MSAKTPPKKVGAEDPPLEQPIDHPDHVRQVDPLADYRDAIASLTASREKVQTLHVARADLEGRLARSEVDREAALSKLSESDDLESEEADALIRITTKTAVLKRKQTDVAKRLEAAEAELAAAISVTFSGFQALYRAFHTWAFERQKVKVAEELIPGVGSLVLEQAVLCSKTMAGIRALELTTTDPQGLTAQAERLLERVSNADGFQIPPWQSNAPESPLAPKAEEPVGLPWSDGRNQHEINAAFLAIRRSNPSLDQAGAYRQLAREHPEWFKSRDEVLRMMEPIEQPKTGIWKAPMVGDTFVPKEPAEEAFSHTR